MMGIKQQIETEIQKIFNKYLASADEINSDYNRENDFAKDYEGRQLFELLQNADDETEKNVGKLKIFFQDGLLRVSNTGTPFSFEGVKSLLRANSSPKKVRTDVIGNKGLGFRAILNWAKKIRVITNEFAIEFSKENAVEFFQKVIAKSPNYVDDLKKLSNDEYPIAILACPKFVDCSAEVGYDTTIEIECFETVFKDINAQIKNICFEELVFLKNLFEIEVISTDYHKIFCRFSENDDVILEERDATTKDVLTFASWHLYKKSGTILDENQKEKKYELAIAYNSENPQSGKYLYSYFKTNVALSFPAIIHGTFDLSANRNYLKQNNPVNRQLVSILADLMVETAKTISETNLKIDYKPLELLFATEIDKTLDEYGLREKILSKIDTEKIFPSISNTYISLQDYPRYSNREFCDILKPESFSNLLKKCDNSAVLRFMETKVKFYAYNEFETILNNDLSIGVYSQTDKIRLLDLISKEYPYSNKYALLLFEDTNGNAVCGCDIYLVPQNEEYVQIPQWASLNFLNRNMQDSLIAYYGKDSDFSLTQYQSWYGINPYNLSHIIDSVIEQLHNELSMEKVDDVICWLFRNYELNLLDDIDCCHFDLDIINRDGKIQRTTDCYFGKEYENDFGEKIISVYSNNFIKDYKMLFNSSDEVVITHFWELIGVAKYPRIVEIDNLPSNLKEYLTFCFDNKRYFHFGDMSYSLDWFDTTITKIKGFRIEHLEDILCNCSTTDILLLLLQYPEMVECLDCSNDTKKTSVCFRPYNKYNYNIRCYSVPKIKSLNYFIMYNVKWLDCEDGIKRSPNYCCTDKRNFSDLIGVPKINYSYIAKQSGVSRADINTLLRKLGVCEKFIELSTDIQYEVLLHLPNVDSNCTFGKKVFSEIKELDPSEVDAGNPNYINFIQNGKVIADYMGERNYFPVSEVLYSNNRIYSNEILKNFKMLCMDYRVGEKKIEKLFGVTPLKGFDVKLVNIPTVATYNEEFKREFKEFCAYILACRPNNEHLKTEIRRLKECQLYLCYDLQVEFSLSDNSKIADLKPYDTFYLRKENKSYIVLPNSVATISSLRQNIQFANAVAETISNILDVHEDQGFYRDLFVKDKALRDYTIREDRGEDCLERVKEFREKLQVVSDNRSTFWNGIAELACIELGKDPIEVAQSICGNDRLFKAINYDDLNAENNYPIYVELFAKINSDVNEFNHITCLILDIRSYWKKLFNKLKKELFAKYKLYLFETIDRDVDSYNDLISDYHTQIPNIDNSVYVNIEDVYCNIYGVSPKTLNNLRGESVDVLIETKRSSINAELYKKLYSIYGNKVDTYILFDKLDELPIDSNETSEESPQTKMDTHPAQIDTTFTDGSTTAKPNSNEHNNADTQKNTHSQRTHNQSDTDRRMEIAQIGEMAVYEFLKAHYDNVSWVSGIAEKAGYVNSGNDNVGYDMTYYINDTQKYVEVKSSRSREVEFHISKAELKFALENPNDYELYFVYVKSNSDVEIIFLGNLFSLAEGETFMSNSKFAIECDNYTIKTTIK